MHSCRLFFKQQFQPVIKDKSLPSILKILLLKFILIKTLFIIYNLDVIFKFNLLFIFTLLYSNNPYIWSHMTCFAKYNGVV